MDNLGDAGGEMPPDNVNVGGTVDAIFAGDAHTCVLLDAGSVRCWGNGESGRLGYGNEDDIGDDDVPTSAGPVTLF